MTKGEGREGRGGGAVAPASAAVGFWFCQSVSPIGSFIVVVVFVVSSRSHDDDRGKAAGGLTWPRTHTTPSTRRPSLRLHYSVRTAIQITMPPRLLSSD